jgi:hypothetical protein
VQESVVDGDEQPVAVHADHPAGAGRCPMGVGVEVPGDRGRVAVSERTGRGGGNWDGRSRVGKGTAVQGVA